MFFRLTPKYERLARIFLAFMLVASFLILWRVLKQVREEHLYVTTVT
jgi:hypothetical protein